jgi:hypothetical protein
VRLYTDWVHLSNELFQEACNQLGTDIPALLKTGFRRRLRSATQAIATAAQPVSTPSHPPLYAFSTGSPQQPVPSTATQPSTPVAPVSELAPAALPPALPPAVMGDAVTPHCSEQPADTRSGTPQVSLAEAVGAAQPTAASAQPSKSTDTVDTVHVNTAAEVSGETCATTS